jgi:predicted nucleotidyltransferase
MRKSPLLSALLSEPAQAILTATLMHPEKWWYLSHLARHVGLRPSSLQRDLARLVDAGILRRRAEGNRVYFRADDSSPVFPELQGLVIKTSGVIEVLGAALEPFKRRIRSAFVFGSIAAGRERSRSDIDLNIVGTVDLPELAPAIRRAEDQLERPIALVHHTPDEFTSKVVRSHFLKEILSQPKLFIIGSEHELEQIARNGKGRPAPDVKAGTGRTSRRHRAQPQRRRISRPVGR